MVVSAFPARQDFVAGTPKAQRFGGTCCQGCGNLGHPRGPGWDRGLSEPALWLLTELWSRC